MYILSSAPLLTWSSNACGINKVPFILDFNQELHPQAKATSTLSCLREELITLKLPHYRFAREARHTAATSNWNSPVHKGHWASPMSARNITSCRLSGSYSDWKQAKWSNTKNLGGNWSRFRQHIQGTKAVSFTLSPARHLAHTIVRIWRTISQCYPSTCTIIRESRISSCMLIAKGLSKLQGNSKLSIECMRARRNWNYYIRSSWRHTRSSQMQMVIWGMSKLVSPICRTFCCTPLLHSFHWAWHWFIPQIPQSMLPMALAPALMVGALAGQLQENKGNGECTDVAEPYYKLNIYCD